MVFDSGEMDAAGRQAFEEAFTRDVARPFGMAFTIKWPGPGPRMALMVSKADHALLELLWRWRNGELIGSVEAVISNHDDARDVAASFGVPYHWLPVTRERRRDQEAQVAEVLASYGVQLLILARYMQILSPEFVQSWHGRVVNIHHSFLPAFVGADPYRQAYDRGVKLIGATAHYVTDELDAGPIIAQDVRPVSHRESVRDLKRLGRELERSVLARAVEAVLDDAVMVHENRTVVFDR
jgi:formyltetrahydrofolate deformylase